MADNDLRMNAYYYSFAPTGVRAIDEILSAVAVAGKAYHHTEYWSDSEGDEKSYVELIQEAAVRAAATHADALRMLGEALYPGLGGDSPPGTPNTLFWYAKTIVAKLTEVTRERDEARALNGNLANAHLAANNAVNHLAMDVSDLRARAEKAEAALASSVRREDVLAKALDHIQHVCHHHPRCRREGNDLVCSEYCGYFLAVSALRDLTTMDARPARPANKETDNG